MKYVASKNQKAFMVDLKAVYKAETQNAKEQALDELEVKYGEQYPWYLSHGTDIGITLQRTLSTLVSP